MATPRQFPLVHVEREGRSVQAMRIECGRCHVGAHYLIANGAGFSSTLAHKYFRNHGWEIGKTARADVCPDCLGRSSEKVESMEGKPAAAEPPREMSREDRRIIFAKIDELYLSDKTGYSPPWTDSAVARDLGVPRTWVSQVREDLFGPEGSNAEFDDFLERAAPIIADLKNLHRSCTAQLEEARKIAERVEPLERMVKRLDREIGKAS
ncbi:MAG: hypothetical protein J0I98_14320 [Mesorhizobium sp.]|nr:hypothetical protein [Mesorhizobium sp.]MBN9243963.1 hypothetical protein [Mesorhizobium sp.]